MAGVRGLTASSLKHSHMAHCILLVHFLPFHSAGCGNKYDEEASYCHSNKPRATHGWVSLGLTILFTSANLRVFFALPMTADNPLTEIRRLDKLTYSTQPDSCVCECLAVLGLSLEDWDTGTESPLALAESTCPLQQSNADLRGEH